MTLNVFYETLCYEEQNSRLLLDSLIVEGKVGDLLAMLNDEVLSAKLQTVEAENDLLIVFATLPEDSK